MIAYRVRNRTATLDAMSPLKRVLALVALVAVLPACTGPGAWILSRLVAGILRRLSSSLSS